MENAEPIICPLWDDNDERFRSRHYHAWDRPCAICGRKVVVSGAVKRLLESEAEIVIVCEECALIHVEALSDIRTPESENMPACPTCDALKEQEESAAAELAHISDLAGSEEARRKWDHIFRARWEHRFKGHNDEPRGR